MRLKELEITLSNLLDLDKPKPHLEQWTTPPRIAAEVLLYAYNNGDIENKICCDFGCGNGIFSIGLALLGAQKVVGIDIDNDALRIAMNNKQALENIYGSLNVEFILADVRSIDIRCDTLVMNPPFGVEPQTRHADRYFLRKGFESAKVIYSLHHSSKKSRRFLEKYAEEYGFQCFYIKSFNFPLRAKYWYHRKELV
ncbi:MAG: METTL5 family protein, partial [Candidatus Njordarchaeota archaeon]